jgi:hypothetical protein
MSVRVPQSRDGRSRERESVRAWRKKESEKREMQNANHTGFENTATGPAVA